MNGGPSVRYLICAGGTGGGVYPALAVHSALTARQPGAETLWVGGEGGMEAELVMRAGIPFRSIPAAGIHGVGLRRLPSNLATLGRGVLASRRILKEFDPDVLFFTGGYVAFPMALAGRSIPTLLYVPDIEPGLAIKSVARFADRIAVTAADSKSYFAPDRRIVVTGYPVRGELSGWTRESGAKLLGLSDENPVVLITGGSQGARSLNHAVLEHLPALLRMAQVIHISGSLDWPEVQAAASQLPEDLSRRYHPMSYLHDMGAALASADLVVSRAGASTLGEYPLFGLPAILIPYPYAWRYQVVNASVLASHHAAILLEDQLVGRDLLPLIGDLLGNPAKREAMRLAMRALRQPDAAGAIAAQLQELAGTRSR
ncbi:MAG: undecaprenyldiphospho-muramoylpentapeptide beta-N-acetylglucosaminyltransferase [Bacteroidota bacterium]